MVEVKVDAIRVNLLGSHRVVVLKDVDANRFLPIFIGQPEADAITIHPRASAVLHCASTRDFPAGRSRSRSGQFATGVAGRPFTVTFAAERGHANA